MTKGRNMRLLKNAIVAKHHKFLKSYLGSIEWHVEFEFYSL